MEWSVLTSSTTGWNCGGDLARVMHPFEQSREVLTSTNTGTGLGLALVGKLAASTAAGRYRKRPAQGTMVPSGADGPYRENTPGKIP